MQLQSPKANMWLNLIILVFLLSDQSSSNSAEVTLNALNAGENEVDVEGLADFGNGIYIGKHYIVMHKIWCATWQPTQLALGEKSRTWNTESPKLRGNLRSCNGMWKVLSLARCEARSSIPAHAVWFIYRYSVGKSVNVSELLSNMPVGPLPFGPRPCHFWNCSGLTCNNYCRFARSMHRLKGFRMSMF